MNTTQYTTIPAGGRITLPTATGRDAPAAATYEVRVDFMVLAYHLRAAAEAADDWMAAMLLDIEKKCWSAEYEVASNLALVPIVCGRVDLAALDTWLTEAIREAIATRHYIDPPGI
jgi:hypothetical protein